MIIEIEAARRIAAPFNACFVDAIRVGLNEYFSGTTEDFRIRVDSYAQGICQTLLCGKALEDICDTVDGLQVHREGQSRFFSVRGAEGAGFNLRVAKGDSNYISRENDSERLRLFKDQQIPIPGMPASPNLELIYRMAGQHLIGVALTLPKLGGVEWVEPLDHNINSQEPLSFAVRGATAETPEVIITAKGAKYGVKQRKSGRAGTAN